MLPGLQAKEGVLNIVDPEFPEKHQPGYRQQDPRDAQDLGTEKDGDDNQKPVHLHSFTLYLGRQNPAFQLIGYGQDNEDLNQSP